MGTVNAASSAWGTGVRLPASLLRFPPSYPPTDAHASNTPSNSVVEGVATIGFACDAATLILNSVPNALRRRPQ